MALSTLNESAKFYDPHYRPDHIALSADSRHSRQVYDDFSVSEHLHILRPQSVSLTSFSLQETVQKRSRNSLVLKKSETMPREAQRSAAEGANLGRCASAKLAAEDPAKGNGDEASEAH